MIEVMLFAILCALVFVAQMLKFIFMIGLFVSCVVAVLYLMSLPFVLGMYIANKLDEWYEARYPTTTDDGEESSQ